MEDELEGVDSTAQEEKALASEGDDLGAAIEGALGAAEPEKEPQPKGEAEEKPEAPTDKVAAKDETQPADAPAAKDREYRTDHWPAQYRAGLEKAPPELQSVWKEQVRNVETKWRQAEDEKHQWRGFAEPIRNLITPERQQRLAQDNLTPAQGIERLLAMNDFFARDPKGYVSHVMKAAGLQPADVFGDAAGEKPADEWVDPETQALRQELTSIKQQLEQQQYQRDYQEGLSQAQKAQRTRALADNWAKATNDDGSPAYPYLDRVRQHMDHLLRHHPNIRQMPENSENDIYLKLHAAYDHAVYLDPEIREGQVMTLAERKRQEEQARLEAEKAKRAQSRVRGGAPGEGAMAGNSLDDMLDAQMRAAGM